MEGEIQLEGFKELIDSLSILVDTRTLQKIVKGAVKEGAKPIKDEAEGRVGKGKGYIGVSTPKVKGDTAIVSIGPVKKHWELIFREFGTKAHSVIAGQVIRRGKNITGLYSKKKKARWEGSGKKVLADVGRGIVFGPGVEIPAQTARPFLRPAVDTKKDAALERMHKFLELVLRAIVQERKETFPEPGGE